MPAEYPSLQTIYRNQPVLVHTTAAGFTVKHATEHYDLGHGAWKNDRIEIFTAVGTEPEIVALETEMRAAGWTADCHLAPTVR